MKRLISVIILLVCFHSIAQLKTIPRKVRNYNTVNLNQSTSTEIGEKMIEKGIEYYQDAYKITSIPRQFSITLIPFPYQVGDILPLSATNKGRELYFDTDKIPPFTSLKYTIGISKSETGNYIPYAKSVNGFKEKYIEGFKAEPTEYVDPKCRDCFKKEFVFNGKAGNSLKFVYREYINDMARPAFNQDLQYDLSESNIIGFKGMRIEVIKATNTAIYYQVLSSFNDWNT